MPYDPPHPAVSRSATATLPIGAWIGGERLRRVRLRGLNGEDEMWLADQDDSVTGPQRVSGLLRRCVRLDDDEVAESGEAEGWERALCVGDREALCLHLRRLTLGDRMRPVLVCGGAGEGSGRGEGCGGTMDLDISASGLLVPSVEEAAQVHGVELRGPGAPFTVRFRLATGADLEEAARGEVGGDGARWLLRRCVQSSEWGDVDSWPGAIVEEIGRRMAQLDPQAEVRLDVVCPECGRASQAVFDGAGYLLRELKLRRTNLMREVHTIATHYHWSEEAILALPRARRQAYLGLIADAADARRTP